jgi:hypothetical protein
LKWIALKIKKEFWNILSSARNNLEWRRNKVLEISSQGLTQYSENKAFSINIGRFFPMC